jgi:hypothetical protein
VLESSLTASEDGTSISTSILTIKPKREDDGEQFLCQVKKKGLSLEIIVVPKEIEPSLADIE